MVAKVIVKDPQVQAFYDTLFSDPEFVQSVEDEWVRMVVHLQKYGELPNETL